MPDNDAVDFGFVGQFTKADQPHPHPDRFKDPQFIAREKDKPGLDVILAAEHGTVMIDFGKPDQAVGLTLHDAKLLIMGLVEAVTVGMLQGENKGPTH